MADRNGYIGRAPSDSSVTIARQINTASGVTTTFTFSAGYDVGYLDVYINGVRLINATDYQATDTSTVILTTPAQPLDVIEFVAYKAFNVGNVSSAPDNFSVGGDINVSGSYSGDGSGLTGIVTGITAGDNISVSGSTGNVTITGLANTANVSANTLNVTGVSTLGIVSANTLNVTGVSTLGIVSANTLNVTGVSTLGQVEGISGISTTFVSAVGIQSGGTTIGTGITQINFIGAGNTFKVDGTTVDVSIESGGGAGLSTTGVSTGYIFSNPQLLNESADLTQPNHNYAVFGPVVIGVGVTINVGAGNTFVVV